MSSGSEGFSARLLLILSSQGYLDPEDADRALGEAKKSGRWVEEVLEDQGLASRRQIAEALADSFNLPVCLQELKTAGGPSQTAVPPDFCQDHQLLPVEQDNANLVVATSSPPSSGVLKDLKEITGQRISVVITDRLSLRDALEELPRLLPPSTKAGPSPKSKFKKVDSGASEVSPESLILAGRYRLGERLMDCRFSTLFKAEDPISGHPQVLRKLEGSFSYLPKDGQSAPLHREARLQILREGRTLSRLRHRNLPRVRDVFEERNDIYLVLDDIPGQTLTQFVSEHPGPQSELLERFLLQFLNVLAYLHQQTPPIIHRDLRPETVLVTRHGVITVAEFGLAKMLDGESVGAGTAFKSQGDPRFAAPEQLLGEGSHPRHDLYSVGALMFYVATGTAPPESLKRLYGDESQLHLGEIRPDIPQRLIEVIEDLLEPEAERRPERANVLQARLQSARPSLSLPLILHQVQTDETPFSVDPGMGTAPVQAESPQIVPDQSSASLPPEKRSMWQLLFGGLPWKERSAAQPANRPSSEEHSEYLQTFPSVNLEEFPLDREVARTLPEAVARAIQGICIGKLGGNELTVACKDPTDVYIYDTIAMGCKGAYKPNLVKAAPLVIDRAMEYVYRSEHLAEPSWFKFLEQKTLDEEALETLSQGAEISFGDEALEGPIVEAVERLIKEAISAGASDIHLEPFETGMDTRYRVDGVLRKVNVFPPSDAGAIIKRIKVLGNLDIAQERVTQGGRISIRVGRQDFDLRVSVVPVPAGESVVMRILKKGAFDLTLSDLGFRPKTEERYRNILTQPYGMILVCGPTGSGKSTTLYASLKEIQRPDRKLLTVEDPIEYQMPGIIQVQVNNAPREAEKKVTFSKALREFLRQDPDVILVGEIRDQETAEIAIQAALTGHLLLSTIHTNDSVGIVARLRDMQCEPFLIGSVLLGGLAQRLARRLCPDCRTEVEAPKEYLELFHKNGIDSPRLFRGQGCRKCHETGSRGRVGLYELLEVTPEVRNLINRGAQEEEIRQVAEAQGFKGLLNDGLQKTQAGLVSLEEVLRVCKTL